MIDTLGDMADDPGAIELANIQGDEFARAARRRVPVDTGNLMDSIQHFGTVGTEVKADAIMIADAEYAGYVEYGTRFQRPQPYWRPAYGHVEDERRTLEQKIQRQMRRAISGGGWSPDYR